MTTPTPSERATMLTPAEQEAIYEEWFCSGKAGYPALVQAVERALLARLGEQQPVAWDRADASDPISLAKKCSMENHNGKPGKALAALYNVPLYAAPIPSPAPVGAQLDGDALYEAIRGLGHTTRGQTYQIVEEVMAMAKQGSKS